MKRFLTILMAAVLIVPSFGQKAEKGRTREVIILHVNDMHARIDDMPKLAYLTDSLRKLHRFVFLVSAGDNFTGNPVVDMVADKGFPMIDLMNRCGFDVSAVGNHEFDLGQEMLNRRFKQARFPFISANIDSRETVLKQPRPIKVLKAGCGNRLALLGIIQRGDNGLPDSHPDKLKGIIFTDGLQKAKEFDWLKEEYGNFIALTHLGIETDTILARVVPDIDLIMGGHSHTLMDPPIMVGDVMITQAGYGLRYIGKTTLQMRKGKVLAKKDEIIVVKYLKKADPKVQKLVDQYNDNPEFKEVLATAETAFSNEEELGCMMTDALTTQLKVDFAFQNVGGIRIKSLPAGNITLQDVYRIDPFGNQVVVYTMNAAQVAGLICNAYNRLKEHDLMVSGMTYTIKTGQDGSCAEVWMKDMMGKPLDQQRTYTVAMNSYMAATYKFDSQDKGKTLDSNCSDQLIQFLKAKKSVNYSGCSRIAVSKP
ncbi:MAG: bifunctional metallophosphatase/5'-nucleotidase [Bacteroidetes bacterium]|nr:bifunctional metallophosphatase/5'-nucleotidase [Bacteroidota bacterium]